MSRTRAPIGFRDALSDLGSFAPAAKPKAVPDPVQMAEAGFVSRESDHSTGPSATAAPAAPAKAQRRRRTGRNAQLNIKTTPEMIARFYALADAQDLGIGEAFERAVALWDESL